MHNSCQTRFGAESKDFSLAAAAGCRRAVKCSDSERRLRHGNEGDLGPCGLETVRFFDGQANPSSVAHSDSGARSVRSVLMGADSSR